MEERVEGERTLNYQKEVPVVIVVASASKVGHLERSKLKRLSPYLCPGVSCTYVEVLGVLQRQVGCLAGHGVDVLDHLMVGTFEQTPFKTGKKTVNRFFSMRSTLRLAQDSRVGNSSVFKVEFTKATGSVKLDSGEK